MKTLLSGTLLLTALTLSFPATADSWNSPRAGWGYDRHRGWSGYHGPRDYRPGYGRRGYGRAWYASQRYRPHGNYFSFSFGRSHPPYRYRRHDVDAGAVLGGVVLGSLLTSSVRHYERPRAVRRYTTVRTAPVIRTREVVYVNKPAPAAPSGRRLLRDLDGNCFEISRRANGDELRIELDPSVCDF